MSLPPVKGPKVQLRAVITSDGRYVPLKFVESINFKRDKDEDTIIDVLKGNSTLEIHTLSGENHIIDLSHVINKMEDISDVDDMWGIVFESWIYHISL